MFPKRAAEDMVRIQRREVDGPGEFDWWVELTGPGSERAAIPEGQLEGLNSHDRELVENEKAKGAARVRLGNGRLRSDKVDSKPINWPPRV